MLSVAFYLLLCWVSLCWMSLCHYAQCRYAECHYVIMLSVVMVNVIMSLFWVSLCWMPLCWVSLRWMSQHVGCTATQYLEANPQSPLVFHCCINWTHAAARKDSIFRNIKFWNDFLFCFCHLLFLNGCFIALSGQNLFNWDTRSILDQFKTFSMANT